MVIYKDPKEWPNIFDDADESSEYLSDELLDEVTDELAHKMQDLTIEALKSYFHMKYEPITVEVERRQEDYAEKIIPVKGKKDKKSKKKKDETSDDAVHCKGDCNAPFPKSLKPSSPILFVCIDWEQGGKAIGDSRGSIGKSGSDPRVFDKQLCGDLTLFVVKLFKDIINVVKLGFLGRYREYSDLGPLASWVVFIPAAAPKIEIAARTRFLSSHQIAHPASKLKSDPQIHPQIAPKIEIAAQIHPQIAVRTSNRFLSNIQFRNRSLNSSNRSLKINSYFGIFVWRHQRLHPWHQPLVKNLNGNRRMLGGNMES
ncbi:hypothetical protein OSB04_019925 [Centaurea solstitialis]|uniref:Uncharacterized protein n=1 Tax=Centaurea solstitialis TaxID=347529 RepID=A0AA38W5F8_9ASTR|nr:hypothetical protein OSB04_019925 [Centaurea solstitialis]